MVIGLGGLMLIIGWDRLTLKRLSVSNPKTFLWKNRCAIKNFRPFIAPVPRIIDLFKEDPHQKIDRSIGMIKKIITRSSTL
jgi:hypothetical protein